MRTAEVRRLRGPRCSVGGLLGLRALQRQHAAPRLLVRLERILVVVVLAVRKHVLLILKPLCGQGQGSAPRLPLSQGLPRGLLVELQSER